MVKLLKGEKGVLALTVGVFAIILSIVLYLVCKIMFRKSVKIQLETA